MGHIGYLAKKIIKKFGMHLYDSETFYCVCSNSRTGVYIPVQVLEPLVGF